MKESVRLKGAEWKILLLVLPAHILQYEDTFQKSELFILK